MRAAAQLPTPAAAFHAWPLNPARAHAHARNHADVREGTNAHLRTGMPPGLFLIPSSGAHDGAGSRLPFFFDPAFSYRIAAVGSCQDEADFAHLHADIRRYRDIELYDGDDVISILVRGNELADEDYDPPADLEHGRIARYRLGARSWVYPLRRCGAYSRAASALISLADKHYRSTPPILAEGDLLIEQIDSALYAHLSLADGMIRLAQIRGEDEGLFHVLYCADHRPPGTYLGGRLRNSGGQWWYWDNLRHEFSQPPVREKDIPPPIAALIPFLEAGRAGNYPGAYPAHITREGVLGK